jgi:hypothetical protein
LELHERLAGRRRRDPGTVAMIALAGLLLAALASSDVCFNHSPSGVEFGPAPEGMACSGPRMLDPSRGDSSVAYKSNRPERDLTVTVFVYRRLPPCCQPDDTAEQHLAEVRAAVADKYTDLTCEPWSPKDQPRMIGLRCSGHCPEISARALVTFMGLEQVGPWWFKVRATTFAEQREDSEVDLAAVLANIHRPIAKQTKPTEPRPKATRSR